MDQNVSSETETSNAIFQENVAPICSETEMITASIDVSNVENFQEKEVEVLDCQVDLNAIDTNTDIIVEVSSPSSSTQNMSGSNYMVDLNGTIQNPIYTQYQVIVSPLSQQSSLLTSSDFQNSVVVKNEPLLSSSATVKTQPIGGTIISNQNKKSLLPPHPLSPISSPSSTLITNRDNSSSQSSTLTKDSKSPSDQLLSQIPLMNSMVRYQLQRLLKIRALNRKKNPSSVNMNRPVAVLTAYSVRKVPDGKGSRKMQNTYRTSVHVLPGKVFHGDFLPIVCEQFSAIIHLDKFYCSGTHRLCVEFGGTLISPLDLLQKAGLEYTANWKAIFRVGNGKSVKMLFDNQRLDFRDHEIFCTGWCNLPSSDHARPMKSFLSNLEKPPKEEWININLSKMLTGAQNSPSSNQVKDSIVNVN